MQYRFFKYQGTGNDFVLLDNRNLAFPKEQQFIERICDRHFGIGADGLMLLETAEDFDFKMVYFNSDGRESSMCGNGGRCISAFARQLDIVKDSGAFLAIDGAHEFSIQREEISLKMMDVASIRKEGDDYVLFTGSPHYVALKEALEEIDLLNEARKIRYSDAFTSEGINVNFVELKDGKVHMRTYERGVEGETLSCGTGTVAVALVVALLKKQHDGTVEILTRGGHLKVCFEKKEDTFTNIWLKGPAKCVFEGTLTVDE